MIEVRRQGVSGNLLELDGAVLIVKFGQVVVYNLFHGKFTQIRYAQQKPHAPVGFAPEDKFWIYPRDDERIEPKEIAIETDPGGDIFLYLGENAGFGLGTSNTPTFPVREISENPTGLLDRGIEFIALPSLYMIEHERNSRATWCLSTVDDSWNARAK